jgi:imidazolonepropionase-like amidohydrolase
MRAAVDEAHALDMKVAAHANASDEGVRRAVEAGVDTIEHGFPAGDSTLEAMAKRGTILVPTLAVIHQLLGVDPKDSPFSARAHERLRQYYEQSLDVVRRARGLGVTIALGTDAGCPLTWHGDGALEMLLYVECGMSPLEALVAGTRDAARAVGREDLGTLEAGKLADMIAVDGEPSADISILRDRRRIRKVIQDGRLVVDRDIYRTAEPV